MSDEIRAEQLWQAARTMIRTGNGWKAKDILRTLITAFPSHAAARSEMAAILYADGDIESALLQAAFAHRLNPELPGLARRLGELYLLTGFYDDALDCLEEALRSGDRDSELAEKISMCRQIVEANIDSIDEGRELN